jgi:hypothetical protein
MSKQSRALPTTVSGPVTRWTVDPPMARSTHPALAGLEASAGILWIDLLHRPSPPLGSARAVAGLGRVAAARDRPAPV